MWTPGYWAYGDEGYFWVPGAWVPAPYVGALWTPGYWGWGGGLYVFHPGYWGYHVGYYGGVNYGFGYMGVGFVGGEWRGGHMAYNTAVIHVNETVIHNTYVNETIVHQNTIVNNNHVAYAGGPGGIQHQPNPEERIAERETHTAPTSFQSQHIAAAQSNHQSYAKVNGGRPATLAVARPLAMENHPAPDGTMNGNTRARWRRFAAGAKQSFAGIQAKQQRQYDCAAELHSVSAARQHLHCAEEQRGTKGLSGAEEQHGTKGLSGAEVESEA